MGRPKTCFGDADCHHIDSECRDCAYNASDEICTCGHPKKAHFWDAFCCGGPLKGAERQDRCGCDGFTRPGEKMKSGWFPEEAPRRG